MSAPPQTLTEAIELLQDILPRRILSEIYKTTPAGLEDLRSTIGIYIRDEFDLTAKDSILRAACETDDPDEAALTVLQVLWYELHNTNKETPPLEPCVYQLRVNEHMDRYFDPTSLPATGKAPEAVLLMGGIAVGKTTIRKAKYSHGYVLIDAAELFAQLSHGEFLPFPGPLSEPLELLGGLIARRAISERRNIVTEIIGAELKPAEQLLAALSGIGYTVSCVGIGCDVAVAQERHASRPENDVSAYEAEPFTIKWLMGACNDAAAAPLQSATTS